MKPGWMTTEFWMTAIVNLLAFAVALGWIGPDASLEVQALSAKVVTGIIAAVGLFNYIYTRYALKYKAMQHSSM